MRALDITCGPFQKLSFGVRAKAATLRKSAPGARHALGKTRSKAADFIKWHEKKNIWSANSAIECNNQILISSKSTANRPTLCFIFRHDWIYKNVLPPTSKRKIWKTFPIEQHNFDISVPLCLLQRSHQSTVS